VIRLFVALLFLGGSAQARDDGSFIGKPLHDWFSNLASKKSRCCSDADGALVQDADWDALDGHYRVRIDGGWRDVPDDTVIREPNLYGRTMVWGYKSNRDIPDAPPYIIYCFLPGAMM
jgi:hypothetical protein